MKFNKLLRKEVFIINKLPFLTFIEIRFVEIFLNDHVVSFSNEKETNVKKIGVHQVSFQDISVRSSKVGLNNHQVSLPWLQLVTK